MRIELFGGLRVCEPGVATCHVPKTVWLIIGLALSPDRRASDPQLERLLFPEESMSMYDTNARLRQIVRHTRRLLGSQEAITRTLGAYVLDPSFVQIDVLQFEAAAADPERAAGALQLYKAGGKLLTGFAFPSGREHPHLKEVEERLRERHEALQGLHAKTTDKEDPRTPVRVLAEKRLAPGLALRATSGCLLTSLRDNIPTLPEQEREGSPGSTQAIPRIPKRVLQEVNRQLLGRLGLLAAAAASLGLATYVWDPLEMPDQQAQEFQSECARRMKWLYDGLPKQGAMPHDCKWLDSPKTYDACCPLTSSPFAYNESLCGARLESIKSPQTTILFYEGQNREFHFGHKGGKAVLLTFDGKTHVVDKQSVKAYTWVEPKH